MQLTRRDTLIMGAGVAAVTLLPLPSLAGAWEDAIAAFTEGGEIMDGGIELTAPEIAENGNTVPISVSAPGAVAIAVFAEGNPNPDVVEFQFGPLAGAQSGSTRCRLAGTQNLHAYAKMPDGSIGHTVVSVKVTIGGCGG
ncbi:MAG: thiosulfate oxidation carrier protein SoxY [Rhodobacteraceae bacterium]|nr:thiosulfate oxidation carrier protein SoxY [Paracoccaceae bacterium]